VDRRKTELHVSAAGLEVLDMALALIAEHEARFRSRFKAAELERLMDYLDRLSEPPALRNPAVNLPL
jgi:hypothetical protein